MPLLYFDVVEGRNRDEIKALLDTAHAATVQAFDVPERDHYQVVRSECGLDPAELIVSMTENADEDWSFGFGRAQFVAVELS